MTTQQLINLLQQVPNKESDIFMWAYTESTDDYLPINCVAIERGDGDVVLCPIDSHKVNDLILLP